MVSVLPRKTEVNQERSHANGLDRCRPADPGSGVDRARESGREPVGRGLEGCGVRVSKRGEELESPAHHLHLHHASLQSYECHVHQASSRDRRAAPGNAATVHGDCGTYDLDSNQLTIRPLVAKNPGFMEPGSFTTFALTTDGKDIWIRATKADTGSIAPTNANRVRLAAWSNALARGNRSASVRIDR
jgi:hypothetical protein